MKIKNKAKTNNNHVTISRKQEFDHTTERTQVSLPPLDRYCTPRFELGLD